MQQAGRIREFMTGEALMRHAAESVTGEQFPEILDMTGARLPLKYRFAPGHPDDGLTLTVPLALLNQLDPARLSWLVPGVVREVMAELGVERPEDVLAMIGELQRAIERACNERDAHYCALSPCGRGPGDLAANSDG